MRGEGRGSQVCGQGCEERGAEVWSVRRGMEVAVWAAEVWGESPLHTAESTECRPPL